MTDTTYMHMKRLHKELDDLCDFIKTQLADECINLQTIKELLECVDETQYYIGEILEEQEKD